MNPDEILNRLSKNAEEVVFDSPWQAQAFAMTVKLHETGQFTWNEWAETLSEEIRQSGSNNSGEIKQDCSQDDYYRSWLAALEKLVVKKQLGSTDDLDQLKKQWANAAEHTPHGQPIKINATIKHA